MTRTGAPTAGLATAGLATAGLAIVASMAVLAATGCRPAVERGTRVTVALGGGNLLGLDVASERVDPVPAGQFCRAGSPALSGEGVVECQLVPLRTLGSRRCPQPPATDPARLCLAPGGAAEELLGWVVSNTGPGQRTLAIFTGTATTGPISVAETGSSPSGGTVPASPVSPVTPADPASPAEAPPTTDLYRRYLAVEPAGAWSELAVCPRDVTGDGLTDLIIVVRSAEAKRRDHIELIVVSAGAAASETRGGGTARGEDESNQAIQRVTPEQPVPRALGEGCASPAVSRLTGAGSRLRLDLTDLP